MSVRIPDDKISEIRSAANIVDLVSEVVRLKRTGKNFVGLCPFHSEKTPSFTVNPDRQTFHCFGCGCGGDIFSFLMKLDNLAYPEAIRTLADKYGVRLPDKAASEKDQEKKSDRELILEINDFASQVYRKILHHTQRGKTAMAYLHGRQISADMIDRFHLGYAPKAWTTLADAYPGKNRFSDLQKAGLGIAKKEGKGVYDRFRNRIIFPIMDVRMQTIGFGGRSIEDEMPKYLNSPETAVYSKSRSLYGLHMAKAKCREKNTVHIVEGYFDCIALHQFGFENTVAALGTALTDEHVRILRGYAEKMILVFDSDEAGIKAALRSVPLFIAQNVKARILVLPEGHDPDSYLRSRGAESFDRMVQKAEDLMGFLTNRAVQKHGMTPEGKLLILNDMIAPLAAIDDDVARGIYVRELSELLSIDETAIIMKLQETAAKQGIVGSKRLFVGMQSGPQDDFKGQTPRLGNTRERLERRLIMMMLQFPGILADIDRHGLLEYFENTLLKSIGMIILHNKDDSARSGNDMFLNMSEEEKRVAAELVIEEEVWEYEGCKRLIQQFLKNVSCRTEQDLNNDIRTAERKGDQELLMRLLHEKHKNALLSKRPAPFE